VGDLLWMIFGKYFSIEQDMAGEIAKAIYISLYFGNSFLF